MKLFFTLGIDGFGEVEDVTLGSALTAAVVVFAWALTNSGNESSSLSDSVPVPVKLIVKYFNLINNPHSMEHIY